MRGTLAKELRRLVYGRLYHQMAFEGKYREVEHPNGRYTLVAGYYRRLYQEMKRTRREGRYVAK